MEAKLSTCFLNGGCYGGGGIKFNQVNVRLYPMPCRPSLPVSCKMRQRNFSPQNKRQQAKKINLDNPENTNIQVNGSEGSVPGIFSKESNSDTIEELELISDGSIPITREAKQLNEKDTTNPSAPNAVDSMSEAKNSSKIMSSSTNILGKSEGREQLSGIHLEDLIGMIKNAEKNIHLLNHARIRALDDLEKILCEKEALQVEINILETKLAETDARLRVAAQEKIHVELLEDQLEKLRKELSSRNCDGIVNNVNDSFPFSQSNDVNSYSEELDLWRTENISLKNELQALKTELSNLKETDERVQMLEKERLSFESSLKELEFKLSASQENVSNISALEAECKSLYEKVEHLQQLLENATKQADQAILALQQNQELRKKVDRLEESLEEANVYKLSSEKMQQYNELMQQKIKILDERLQRSDEEIDSYVQLYQNSMKEFQDTLTNLKEEGKKRSRDDTVNEMPPEFWSRLLLMIDGWFLEKKVSAEDVMLLRDMIWKNMDRVLLLVVGLYLLIACVPTATPLTSTFGEENPIQQVVDGLHEIENSIIQIAGDCYRARTFARFAHRFGKRYKSTEEMKRRYEIFTENLKMIRSHNKKGLSYTLGINEFADLTWDEFRGHKLGAAQNCSATTRGNHKLTGVLLPEMKDWRKAGIVSPVKNQGHCGSCWTFSTTGALEAAYAQAFGKGISLSEQQLVDCAGAFNNFGCNGGLPSQAFEYIKYNGGLETEAAYPYTGKDGVCKYSSENSAIQVLDSVNITLGAEYELKHAVGTVRPVSVAFEVVTGFRFYKGGVYSSTKCGNSPMDVNHAVLAVGYGVENGVPYWLIKNSWGADWGDKGYFKMEMGKNMCGVATCASYPVVT